MSTRDEGVRILKEKYLQVLEDLSNKIKIESGVKSEAVRRIDILANKLSLSGDNPRAVVGAVVFAIEGEKGMPGRSQQIAEALDLAAMSITENARRHAIHFRKSN